MRTLLAAASIVGGLVLGFGGGGGSVSADRPIGTEHPSCAGMVKEISGSGSYTVTAEYDGWTFWAKASNVHELVGVLHTGDVIQSPYPVSSNKHDISHVDACPPTNTPPGWVEPTYPTVELSDCVEYRLEKSTSTWASDTGTWSAWTDWPDAGPLAWGEFPSEMTGHHGGAHGKNGDRHFAYVIVDQRPITTGECAPPNPCAANYFEPSDDYPTGLWEITWGRQFSDTGSEPTFRATDNGGLVTINGNPTDWSDPHLYVSGANVANGRTVTYGFADGTVRTAVVSGDPDGCPSVVWTETPPPPTDPCTPPIDVKDIETCRPENPEPEVTESTPECGDTTVQVTTTNYVYEYNSETGEYDKVLSGTAQITTRDLTDEELAALNAECPPPPPVDICTTAIPGPGSVAQWISDNGYTNADDCFDYAVSQECGVANGSVTLQVQPQYAAGPFRLVWNEGDGIDLDNAQAFPATFPEDYNGGSVTISYYIVGPEKDWFIGSELPNFWGNIYKTLVVDTDCQDPPETTPELEFDCDTVTNNGGDGFVRFIEDGDPVAIAAGATISIPEGAEFVQAIGSNGSLGEPQALRSDCDPVTTTPTTPTTPNDERTVSIAAIGPVCHKDAPYVQVKFGGSSVFNGRTATITFLDVNGAEVGVHQVPFQAGATNDFLYPGAEIDAEGNGVDWPGWEYIGGQWVPDASDAQLRDGLTVLLEVNPSDSAMVEYPAAVSGCALPTAVSASSAEPPAQSPQGPAPAPQFEGTLPQTGSGTNLLAAFAAVLIAAGAGAMLVTRSRKSEA